MDTESFAAHIIRECGFIGYWRVCAAGTDSPIHRMEDGEEISVQSRAKAILTNEGILWKLGTWHLSIEGHERCPMTLLQGTIGKIGHLGAWDFGIFIYLILDPYCMFRNLSFQENQNKNVVAFSCAVSFACACNVGEVAATEDTTPTSRTTTAATTTDWSATTVPSGYPT